MTLRDHSGEDKKRLDEPDEKVVKELKVFCWGKTLTYQGTYYERNSTVYKRLNKNDKSNYQKIFDNNFLKLLREKIVQKTVGKVTDVNVSDIDEISAITMEECDKTFLRIYISILLKKHLCK